MKKIYLFFAVLCCCMMNVQLNAQTVLYESDGIHYVLVAMSFGDKVSRSAYVVHPETTLENENVPTTPSPYTGAIVIADTIRYEGNAFPVKFLNDSAFHQSTITSIDLPVCITTFSPGAFLDCQMLQTIICRATTPPTTNIRTKPWNYEEVFGLLDPNQVSVYVPNGTVLDYQETGGWDTFTHFYTIESMQGIETISYDPSSLPNKIIENNHVIIIRDGERFDLIGKKL